VNVGQLKKVKTPPFHRLENDDGKKQKKSEHHPLRCPERDGVRSKKPPAPPNQKGWGEV